MNKILVGWLYWGDTCVSWLSYTSTNTTFFPKPLTTFLTYFSRVERRKYAREKGCLNWVLNPQPAGHESDTLTSELPGLGNKILDQPELKANE